MGNLVCSSSCTNTRSCSISFDLDIIKDLVEVFSVHCILSTYRWDDGIMWELCSSEYESSCDGISENGEKNPDYDNNTNRVHHIFFVLYWSWPDNMIEFVTRFFDKIGHRVMEIRDIQTITDKSIWNLLLSSKHFKIRRSGQK